MVRAMQKMLNEVEFRISAKDLGELMSGSFCGRCFWIRRHFKVPYQRFPGIFSSIDAHTKKVVRNYVKEYHRLPKWDSFIGALSLVEFKASEFRFYDKETRSLLTGIPDEVFAKDDGSYVIVDYKTAKFTGTQDSLMPIYEVQLNAYAFISENIGYSPVHGIYLIYFEPPNAAESGEKATESGLDMKFSATMIRLGRNVDVLKLLRKAKEIFCGEMPAGRHGCSDCSSINAIASMLSHKD